MNIKTTHPTDKLPLFLELSTETRDALRAAAHGRTLKKGTPLFHHGDPCHSFFIVTNGAIRIHRETPEGKDITLRIAIIGDTLGEEEMLTQKHAYQTSAIAAEDSELLECPASWMYQQIKKDPTLALNLLTATSKHNSRAMMDREQMVTLKTPQRIGCFLMQLCTMYQFDPAHFTLPYSKSTIASKLGMEPESFSRALAKLKDVGITVSGSNVSIADMEALNRYVCNACSVSEDCNTCAQAKHLA